jgi:hypothetical protein
MSGAPTIWSWCFGCQNCRYFRQWQTVALDVLVPGFNRVAILDLPQPRLLLGHCLGNTFFGDSRDVDVEVFRLSDQPRIEEKVRWLSLNGRGMAWHGLSPRYAYNACEY